MNVWLIFFRERFPLPVLALMSLGIGFSVVGFPAKEFSLGLSLLGALLSFLFLSVLRIMDEIKDFEKDKVIHPERPLPRGLIQLRDARRMMVIGLVFMLLASAASAVLGYPASACFFVFAVGYLWLMFKEFYIGTALEKSPYFYAWTHQIVILPIAGSLVLMGGEAPWLEALLKPGLLLLGAFFAFELCRKLDPAAHPLQKTYRQVYGLPRTLQFLAISQLTSMVGAYLAFGLSLSSAIFWVLELSLFVLAVSLAKNKAKLMEGCSALHLLLHLWLPAVFVYGLG